MSQNKIREYANFYTKFWYRNAAGIQMLAHNAPANLNKFLNDNRQLDSQLVYEALNGLATGIAPDDRSVPELLQWFSINPQAATRCDEVLQQKQKVNTLFQLLNKAYSLERSRITDMVHKFLLAATTIK